MRWLERRFLNPLRPRDRQTDLTAAYHCDCNMLTSFCCAHWAADIQIADRQSQMDG